MVGSATKPSTSDTSVMPSWAPDRWNDSRWSMRQRPLGARGSPSAASDSSRLRSMATRANSAATKNAVPRMSRTTASRPSAAAMATVSWWWVIRSIADRRDGAPSTMWPDLDHRCGSSERPSDGAGQRGSSAGEAAGDQNGAVVRPVTLEHLTLAVLVVALGATVQGTVGFGQALIATPLLLLIDGAWSPGRPPWPASC